MNFRQVHLDFHTSGKIGGIGSKFSKKQFQEALIKGHVNSITVFSKCHHGWAYHPSKKNVQHPGLEFDLLAAQIEAAHEIGVKTPVYISAGLDEKFIRQHPEWRLENREHQFDNFSTPGYHQFCLNTPYLDVLLEQITEVLEHYDADGIFLDIVGVRTCCCGTCMRKMMERGMDPNDPADILKMGEETYANYVKRVRETVDALRPGLPVFHNGGHIRQGRQDLAYADSHLELESLPTGGWGYDHFPFTVRYAQNLGLEYLGMTGKFHTSWGEFGGYKHPNALRYEAALSVAHGAKCSIGDQMSPDGHMDMTTYSLIGAAYSEVEEKEPWLDGVTPVNDIAYLSVEAVRNSLGAADLGSGIAETDAGAARILMEGKYQYTVIDPVMDFAPYKVIILPDRIEISDELEEKLKGYIAKGGKILATGTSPVKNKNFVFDFGAVYEGCGEFDPSYVRPLWDNEYETDYIMYGAYQKVSVTDGCAHAMAVKPYFNRTKDHFCSHQHTPSSKECACAGMVEGKDGIYIGWEIFKDYAVKGELIAKTVVCKALDLLLGKEKSLVTTLGAQGVTTLMHQKEEKRYVAHLLYAVPTKRGKNIEIIEDIYPVYHIGLGIKVPEKVTKAYLAPSGQEISFVMEDGYCNVMVDKLECHQMVVFETE